MVISTKKTGWKILKYESGWKTGWKIYWENDDYSQYIFGNIGQWLEKYEFVNWDDEILKIWEIL